MFRNQNVSASEVLSTRDMKVRPERDVTEIVGTFLTVAEAVVAHWVEYSKGLLLFVMVPGDDRSPPHSRPAFVESSKGTAIGRSTR